MKAKRLTLFITLLTIFAVSISLQAQEESGGTYRSAFRTGCMQGSLWTTCGHRLDATVLQPLAAMKWTADELQPLLAESWSMEEDGSVWMVNLREGVTWHDGEPFNADDVVFSFNAYANPAVGSAWATKVQDIVGYDEFQAGEAESLEGVTAVDDLTVRFELKQPSPLWMQLQQIFIVIFPEHILGEVPAAELLGHPYWENRVGTGPFKWVEYVPDQYITVERNEDYFLGAPRLERIVYQIYSDIPTILNALENQEVDSMSYEGGGIPDSEVPRFLEMDHLTVLPSLNAGLPTYIQWDLTKAPFNDPNFRAAVLHAIDRQTIIDTVMYGGATLSNTQFPQAWAVPDDLENAYPYDPDRAQELLAEVEYNSEPIDFIYYYTDNVSAEVMVAIQGYLAQVGINIEPRLLDPASIQATYRDGTFQMGYFANGQGLDPSLGAVLTTCGAQLALGYCNERVDELHTLGLSTADTEERTESYHEISRILNQDLQKGYLWNVARPLAFNNRIVGLSEHWLEQPVVLFNIPVYNEIETWYIEEE